MQNYLLAHIDKTFLITSSVMVFEPSKLLIKQRSMERFYFFLFFFLIQGICMHTAKAS